MSRSLAGAAWLAEPRLARVLAALDGPAGGARVVGGAARDALLGIPIGDIDIATVFPPEETIRRLSAAGVATVPTGLAHGTVTAVIDGAAFEVTTLRRDVETDGRHAIVAFTEDWAADAARRDFTLNAIYVDAQGAILDPTGLGLSDLDAGRVRFVGEPARRIAEDYLRVLRFFRFHARFGRGPIDADGLAACAAAKDELGRLAVERVWREMAKLLAAPDPGATIVAMSRSGVLTALLGHAPDVAAFERFAPLDRAAPSPLGRLTALVGAEVSALAERWRFAGAERRHVEGVASVAADPPAKPWTALRRHGAAIVIDGLRLAWARGRSEALSALPTALAWTNPPFPISGADALALGLKPGPEVGALLGKVAAWWEDGGCLAGRAECLEKLGALVVDAGARPSVADSDELEPIRR